MMSIPARSPWYLRAPMLINWPRCTHRKHGQGNGRGRHGGLHHHWIHKFSHFCNFGLHSLGYVSFQGMGRTCSPSAAMRKRALKVFRQSVKFQAMCSPPLGSSPPLISLQRSASTPWEVYSAGDRWPRLRRAELDGRGGTALAPSSARTFSKSSQCLRWRALFKLEGALLGIHYSAVLMASKPVAVFRRRDV